jgi:nucleoside-diphosphate-sugar epimerase
MENSKREIKNVNVAVIGGAGFIGSHLVNHLIDDRNCNVIVLDNLISGFKKYIHPKAKFIWCDITHSEEELIRIFRTHEIEYVFNYSAEPYIPVSFERPLHVFDINARGALMAMNASQIAGVKGFLQVSSAEIYGDAPEHKITEEYPATPHSTYGASKLAIDTLVQARWRESKMPAIALRQFNCLGERETHPYVVTTIIDQLAQAPVLELGNNSFRDFQYAGDAVKMATELLEKGQFGEVYNMGSEEGVKIYDLAQMIGEVMGYKDIIITEDEKRKRPWEIWHLQSDNTKLYSVIETRPQVTLKESLERVVNFYKSNGNKWDYE